MDFLLFLFEIQRNEIGNDLLLINELSKMTSLTKCQTHVTLRCRVGL